MKPDKLNAEQMEALKKELRAMMPKGSTVYTILRRVSKSGISRVISPVIFTTTGRKNEVRPSFPDYRIAQVLGWSLTTSPDGIKVTGCGMDMGFHLVYVLSQALYGRGNGKALNHSWL